MPSSPLVSVVIPTFNGGVLLIETLNSVFAQTFTDYEVVVVNDGSTDNTADLLSGYADRIRLVTQENQGIGAARNRGIDEARGRYIALLDHDDLWLPDKLQRQVDSFKQHPQCVAISVPYAYSTDPAKCAFDLRIADEDGIVQNALQKYAGGIEFILSAALMFDRNAAAGLRYETARDSIEDLAFHLQLLLRGPFGLAGNDIQVIYRLHDASASKSARHFYNGIRHLRALERSGRFGPLSRADHCAIKEFLAFWGRIAAARQLMAGLRAKGALLYFREFPHQLARGQIKFLAGYPLLLASPQRLIAARFPGTART